MSELRFILSCNVVLHKGFAVVEDDPPLMSE